MTRRFVAAVLLILAAVSARTIRAQSTPHAMYVSVVDQAGNPVPDLGPSDFVIREDKVAREATPDNAVKIGQTDHADRTAAAPAATKAKTGRTGRRRDAKLVCRK